MNYILCLVGLFSSIIALNANEAEEKFRLEFGTSAEEKLTNNNQVCYVILFKTADGEERPYSFLIWKSKKFGSISSDVRSKGLKINGLEISTHFFETPGLYKLNRNGKISKVEFEEKDLILEDVKTTSVKRIKFSKSVINELFPESARREKGSFHKN